MKRNWRDRGESQRYSDIKIRDFVETKNRWFNSIKEEIYSSAIIIVSHTTSKQRTLATTCQTLYTWVSLIDSKGTKKWRGNWSLKNPPEVWGVGVSCLLSFR